jgi:hypothetical protein
MAPQAESLRRHFFWCGAGAETAGSLSKEAMLNCTRLTSAAFRRTSVLIRITKGSFIAMIDERSNAWHQSSYRYTNVADESDKF